MKYMILLLLLPGCVSLTYDMTHPNGAVESLELKSYFKSVNGLSAVRTPELFALGIDKTNSNDVIGDVAKILEFYNNP